MFLNVIVTVVEGSLALVAGTLLVRLYLDRYVWRHCTSTTSLLGRTVLITGGNSGIGKATAEQLLRRDANVIIACRDPVTAAATVAELRTAVKSVGSIQFKIVDLSSFASIKSFSKSLIESKQSIDILINNAAVYGAPLLITEDGFERHFAVNHLGPALLTELLLPCLEANRSQNQQAHLCFVTSMLYKYGELREIDFKPNEINESNFAGSKAYANSKLAALLYSQELAKRLQQDHKPIITSAVSPGIVHTNLSRHKVKGISKLFFSAVAFFLLRTPKQGCQSILTAILENNQNGTVYRNCQKVSIERKENDDSMQSLVYKLTQSVIQKATNL